MLVSLLTGLACQGKFFTQNHAKEHMSRRKIIRQPKGQSAEQAETKKKCLICGTTLSSYNPGPYCYAHTEGMAVKEHYPVTKVTSRSVPGADDSSSGSPIGSEERDLLFNHQEHAFTEEVTGVVLQDKKTGKIAVGDINKFFGI